MAVASSSLALTPPSGAAISSFMSKVISTSTPIITGQATTGNSIGNFSGVEVYPETLAGRGYLDPLPYNTFWYPRWIGYMVVQSTIASIAVAQSISSGTTQNANSLPAEFTEYNSVTAGTAVTLWAANTMSQTIVNAGANALLIFPPTGCTINNLAANASLSLAAGSTVKFRRFDTRYRSGF